MKTEPAADLFFSRFADGDWRGIVRPWLEAGRGLLERAIVVAPTRGQTQAMKQRCADEGVALMGVEFLTPGLARKKRGSASGLGRSLQLLVLRSLIEARLAALGPDDPARGLWKSLSSDLEPALSEFDDLIRAGLQAGNFPRPELGEVFGEMAAWAGSHGYELGPMLDKKAAFAPPGPGAASVADRLLILAGGAEGWADFFGLVALARRCPSVTVVVAEPEFIGKGAFGEEWVGAWETVLGVEARAVGVEDPAEGCAGVAELWSGGGGSAERADALVGRSPAEEMELVADRVVRLLSEGSENIAVVFPGSGVAHARLSRLLEGRGVAYADLIGVVGTPPVDTRIQRALADFYERGCRLEELLAIWPLLRSLSLAGVTLGEARSACQKLFDEAQSHSVALHVERLEASREASLREVGRVARLLLPGWPEHLTPSDALARFEAAIGRLALPEPAGWQALREFAGRAQEPMPARALLEAIRAFLPEKGTVVGARPWNGFARVTLTTCRRAAGVAWSDAIFAESNRGVWPDRREPSSWLGDDARRRLQASLGRFSLGLPTCDERAALERRLCCAIARDTSRRVVFSAALFREDEPEVKLGPNAWLERVMWSKGMFSGSRMGAEAFERMAGTHHRAGGAPGPSPGWFEIWSRRRDPGAPFDEFFLGDPRGRGRPGRLSASQIERGIKDPATLWFGAVLGAERVEWRPFARSRAKAIGTAVHSLLAVCLRGAPAEGSFSVMPDRASARARLAAELELRRASRPADRYWDSFHMDASWAAREMLERVFELPAAAFGAIELRLPKDASVPVSDTERMPVSGRMDLVLSDRPGLEGARVEIVDFKTGRDKGLSASRMESSGASLQLGVYLEAARSLGASGSVWMLKPDERSTRIGMDELGRACAKLRVIGAHLSSGLYGALTGDRTEYAQGFEWPLACAPIAFAILESKFGRTFGAGAPRPGEDGDE